MTITMNERLINSSPEQGSNIQPVGENEKIFDLSYRENNLGELVHYGRVRLYAKDGSVAEIGHPTREAWRDGKGWYHVQLEADLSDTVRPSGFHSGPLPAGAQTVVHDRDFVQVGSELFSSVLFESSARRGYDLGPLFDKVLLRDIQKVELIVASESYRDVCRELAMLAIGEQRLQDD